MKYYVDLVIRDQLTKSLKIKGWVLSDLSDEPVTIDIQTDEPSFKNCFARQYRPELNDPTGRNAKVDSGFIIEIGLNNFQGKVRLKFSTSKEKQELVLDLNKRYCSPVEEGSPILFAHKAFQKIKPYTTTQGRRVLEQKIKRKLKERIPGVSNDYKLWIKNNENLGKLNRIKRRIERFDYKPLVSLIVPVYNVKPEYLTLMVNSIRNQYYQNWELCIADDCSTDPKLKQLLKELPRQDKRIKVVERTENGHICEASNTALNIANGEYVGLVDHDDELAPNALYEVVSLLNEDRDLDFIYSDEDKIDIKGKRSNPYFKSDYAPDSLMAGNYICHFAVLRKRLVDQIGRFRPGFEGAQDHDLFLRAVEQTNKIKHIPQILYHWRMLPESTASAASAKNYAFKNGVKAVSEAAQRRGRPAQVTAGAFPGVYDVMYEIKGAPLVSIIVPTKNNGETLKTCINSICNKTDYQDYEIIIADNGSTDPVTLEIFEKLKSEYPDKVKVIRIDIPFNYSRINNLAVEHASGDYLLFLNDDTEVVNDCWMSSMLGFAQHEETGPVGAKLLYPDNTIQHAGVVLGIGGVAGHIHYHYPKDEPGYFSKLAATTNYSCVTAACLMLDRKKFEEIGGFDENIAVAFNDVDLCCALTDAGYYGVYDPKAVLYHYESMSRGYETTRAKVMRMNSEIRKVQSKWPNLLEDDPMYNPNLSLDHSDFSLRLS